MTMIYEFELGTPKPPPPLPSHTKPSPLLSCETVLLTLLPAAFALGPASMPHKALPHCPTDASPLPLNPLPHTTSPIAESSHAPPPPALSLASIAPLVSTSTGPAISWLSEHLSPACKAGKTLLQDAFKLSSIAVPYLFSFGWGQRYKIKNSSHRKWYKLGRSGADGAASWPRPLTPPIRPPAHPAEISSSCRVASYALQKSTSSALPQSSAESFGLWGLPPASELPTDYH